MSFLDTKEVRCVCGKVFNAKIFLSANVTTNPELRDIILEGRFNVVECPKCKKFLYVEIPFFYLDAEESIVIYVYPKNYEVQKERYLKESQLNFDISLRMIENVSNDDKDYFLQVFFGIEHLVEFLVFQQKENDEKEFLNQVADSMNLKIIDFSKSYARRKNIISKLPYLQRGDKVGIDDIIDGLDLLLKKYPQLSIYRKFLDETKFNDGIRKEIISLLEKK